MIHVENVSRCYGTFVAVEGASFSIGQSQIVGLLGHNGAGKTTIMKMITGYLEPSDGKICVGDYDIASHPESAQQLIGYLPESLPVYPEMTVIDYLFYCAELRNIPAEQQDQAVANVIRKTELGAKALDLISTLSRGYKQRVGVAQALIHKPKLLILDEPTNGLDPQQTRSMRALIRELASEATVILSTHIMQEVDALCDRVLILDNGKLVVDESLDELRKSDSISLVSDINEEALNPLILQLAQGNALSSKLISDKNAAANQFSISWETDSDINALCAELSEAIIKLGHKIYSIHPVQRDLESVFRAIHDQKEVSNAA